MNTRSTVRKLLAAYVLVAAALFATPPEPVSAAQCGCPPATSTWQCFDCGSYVHAACSWGCGYAGPCQDQCDQDWFDNQAACMNCPI